MQNKILMKNKWIVLILTVIWLNYACETSNSYFYVKARETEELKIHAFERCGKRYKVIAYEDDTAIIKCLENN